MSRPSPPSLQDILQSLAYAADRVLVDSSERLDPFCEATIRRGLTELELRVPGLETPPNADAAHAFLLAGREALERSDGRECLAYALRGLSCSPHDPLLCYLAAAACVEVGAVETALRLLYHTLWIHPGHESARRDLEALTAFAQQAALAVENARILTQLETSLFELREAQARLARTARLSAAGEIAAGVAHQINNPLTTVIAEAHLLGMDIKPDDPQRESVDAIRQAAERAGSVVQRLLDLTRVHDYVMEPLDVNESLQNSIALVRAQIEPHLTRLDVRLEARLPLVSASRQHLEDVWLNLLLNARDALSTAENGMIKVSSAYDAAARVIRVTVQDNGPGIPPDQLKNIFEPFFTTKDYGTGLGLAICRDVVIRHSGQISVDSVQGQGTTFTVTLPAGPTIGSE